MAQLIVVGFKKDTFPCIECAHATADVAILLRSRINPALLVLAEAVVGLVALRS
jgi:hypothetical protein